jgi:hypothetical protein
VLIALANGIGILIYLALWLLIPYPDSATGGANQFNERVQGVGNELREAFARQDTKAPLWIGGGLILLGALLFAQNLNVPWLRWVSFDLLWPLLLVIAGAVLILRRGSESNTLPPGSDVPRDSAGDVHPG